MQSVWKAVKPTNQRNGSLHVKQMQGSKVWGIGEVSLQVGEVGGLI